MGRKIWPESSSGGLSSLHHATPDYMYAVQHGGTLYIEASTAVNSSTFWSRVNEAGANLDTNWTADTYKTVVDVSSQRGLLMHVLGPYAPNSATTFTFRITIDGTAYTYSFTTSGQERVGMHCALGHHASSTDDTITQSEYRTVDTNYAGELMRHGSNVWVPTFLHPLAWGMRMVEYTTSLKVEIKIDAAQTATANQERQCGVIYTRLPDRD